MRIAEVVMACAVGAMLCAVAASPADAARKKFGNTGVGSDCPTSTTPICEKPIMDGLRVVGCSKWKCVVKTLAR